jgi:hypothetical protein
MQCKKCHKAVIRGSEIDGLCVPCQNRDVALQLMNDILKDLFANGGPSRPASTKGRLN